MWLHEKGKEDTFEALVQWVEIRVQIMEGAKEDSGAEDKCKKRHTEHTAATREAKSVSFWLARNESPTLEM